MAIEHSVIPNAGLHEPKGADTANADEQLFSDGLGGTSWSKYFSKLVPVKAAADLSGTLDSTLLYVIDGVIDMAGQSIEVPSGGLNFAGHDFDVSKLTSSTGSYTMFTSPGGGSGNVLFRDVGIEVTGVNSRVFNITSATGNDAIEMARVNFNNCTSLGTITGYRQGLEQGTGRFGGTPDLTLAGTWAGGYFIETSIVRSLDAGMTGSLYQAGTGFSMSSRFRSNQNIDLPASASFLDFAASNFPNPSTLQLDSCIVSRNGTFNPTDTNLTPNITEDELPCSWSNNIGLENTFEGGRAEIGTEIATVVGATNTYYDIAGTWNTSDLQHFDSPANGQLRHLGNSPRVYTLIASLALDAAAADDLRVRVYKWDDSASTFVEEFSQVREVNNLVGGRNVAFFTIHGHVVLDQSDYIKLQVRNETTTTNITAELDSFFELEER